MNLMYSKLKEYLKDSVVVEISEIVCMRLSKELLKKYIDGKYDKRIDSIKKTIAELESIGLVYPSNARPKYYIYVVPDEEFRELLDYPSSIVTSGGAKSVPCYDLDGFPSAYGVSSNCMERMIEREETEHINDIHEFAHLAFSIFFHNHSRFISEGLAECAPLYGLDYESTTAFHRRALSALQKDDIMSAKKLTELENSNNFHTPHITDHPSVSFEIGYVSSYLFVRSCLDRLEDKENCDKRASLQKLLELLRTTVYYDELLIYEIAHNLDLSPKELLYETNLQWNTLQKLLEVKSHEDGVYFGKDDRLKL